MKTRISVCAGLAAMAANLVLAVPASAAGQEEARGVCLRTNFIEAWEVPDERTLIVTDFSGDRFEVSLTGICIGLDESVVSLAFGTPGQFSCLKRSDTIGFNTPAFGPQRCMVLDVVPYIPPDDGESVPAEAPAD